MREADEATLYVWKKKYGELTTKELRKMRQLEGGARVAMAATRRRSVRLINWLQDIFPETAVELGVPFMRGPLAMSFAALRNRSLHRAVANVVIGDLMRQKVEALGVPARRIHVIPNWCNDDRECATN